MSNNVGTGQKCITCGKPCTMYRERCKRCSYKFRKEHGAMVPADITEEQLEAVIAEQTAKPLPTWWERERKRQGDGGFDVDWQAKPSTVRVMRAVKRWRGVVLV